MLVNNDHVVKITDFGSAEIHFMFHEKNSLALHMGSPIFGGPEIHDDKTGGRGDAYQLDVFAAGVTLFNMVTGVYPFEPPLEKNTGPIISASGGVRFQSPLARLWALHDLIKKGEFVTPPAIVDNPGLHTLIAKMLKVDPKDRATITDVLRDAWTVAELPGEPFAKLPPRLVRVYDLEPDRRYGDNYRSMTITPYLHEHHYPLPPEDAKFKTLGKHEASVHRRALVPYVRANRTPPRPRSPTAKHSCAVV